MIEVTLKLARIGGQIEAVARDATGRQRLSTAPITEWAARDAEFLAVAMSDVAREALRIFIEEEATRDAI